jgi:hypothetical protein
MKNLIIAVVAVLAGAAAGYLAPRLAESKPAPAVEEVNPLEEKLKAAEDRIKVLEGELVSAKAKAASARPAEKKDAAPDAPAAGPEDDLQKTMMSLKPGDDLLEKFKDKIPEDQLAQIHDVFEKMRIARANRARGRLAFLESVDVSGMTDDERANHTRLQELLAKREELASKMKAGVVPDFGAIAEIAQVGEEMDSVAKQERSALIRQTGRVLGYSGDDVEVFHDTMIDVFDATSSGGAMGTLNELFNPGAAMPQMPMMGPGGGAQQ